ncbi:MULTISPECIES: bifunctional cytochrome P450/NADPH--P450 reductase [Paenibacillus]|uniref:Bifunctional cytochrome P450/NADPH--P450 reductase n=1 Tax=Paenibacillus albilobatus TaxID=2716884 RepID=A0A919XC72_9BACL|nr:MULTISPECIES: bifunctional cytochrome P450/NADPH--P450 reductase [Paenibacillus]GIO28964.1 NADPH--cytochrome P450 reductase [Paenibacillus albilobatus]
MTETIQVPQPKTYGPLGNLPLLDSAAPVQSLVKVASELGPIFQFQYPGGRKEIYVSGHEYVKDACDEKRFDKRIWAPLQNVRAFAGDGLFTSATQETNWKKAHNILLSSFSQRAMQGYHAKMLDIALQLIQKWGRLNPGETVDVPADMTRLTLDTIGLCGFSYRFNSFYREDNHPFIDAMVRALDEGMNQLHRLGIQDMFMVRKKRQFQEDIQAMFSLVDELIRERKAQGGNEDDLLAHMLEGVDADTGERLDQENIRYQIITFLIAGHETTSGLLSFAIYFLMKNPDKLRKAVEEVDRVLKDPVPTYNQVRDLKYVRMVLSESLRLWPTAPAFSLYAKEDTWIGGNYPIQKGNSVTVLIPALHRDARVWGDDVEAFRPERFEDPSKVPHDAYKPFGNGQRACIGQQFALQEATLVLGMVLKYFDLTDADHYELKVKETLTLKPEGFRIRVNRRGAVIPMGYGSTEPVDTAARESSKPASLAENAHHTPLLVLYGSNLGTAEGIAREVADLAKYQGFDSQVGTLDDYAGALPKEGAVIIVTASYNGQPPSNAKAFIEWLESAENSAVQGVRYAVFGCGDHNWASTYQRIPRLIDELLTAKGAKQLLPRGESDASGDFEREVDDWTEHLWPDLMQALGLPVTANREPIRSTLSLRFVQGVAAVPLAETYGAVSGRIVRSFNLQHADSGRVTQHVEIALPEGTTYCEGDHLGVLPVNPEPLVRRVLRRFRLDGSAHLILEAGGKNIPHLKAGVPVRLDELLSRSVELQEPATRAQIREMAACTVCPPHARELEALLVEETFQTDIRAKRVTMLDLLEQYDACELPFARFLELLPALKPRYYSISSSPQVSQDTASITVGVVRGEAWNGKGEYRGIASNYLAGLEPGAEVLIFVRSPESGFALPEDSATPLIMVGPGTGVAPFRGFIQARRALQAAGKVLGEAHLYFGCRNPEHDYLYRAEFEQAERDGLVTLHTAYSRVDGVDKCYVQHLMKQDGELLLPLLETGAKLYICGDGSRMAPQVEQTIMDSYRERSGASREEAAEWLAALEAAGNYVKDVWAG